MTGNFVTTDAPTPKTNLIKHFENFGEVGMYFSGSMTLALTTCYFKQLEIILAVAYITALIYAVLTFDNAPRTTFFRIAAITAGVLLGIRELLVLFWVSVTSAIVAVIALAFIIYLGIRHFKIGVSQGGWG